MTEKKTIEINVITIPNNYTYKINDRESRIVLEFNSADELDGNKYDVYIHAGSSLFIDVDRRNCYSSRHNVTIPSAIIQGDYEGNFIIKLTFTTKD